MYPFIRKCTDPHNVMMIIISMWLAQWISPSFQTHLQKMMPYKESIETIMSIVIPVFISLGVIGFVTWIVGAWLSEAKHPVLKKIESSIDAIMWELNGKNLAVKGFTWTFIMISASYVLGMDEVFNFSLQMVIPVEFFSLTSIFRYLLITTPFLLNSLLFLVSLPANWRATYHTPVQIMNHRLEVAGEQKKEEQAKIAK